MIRLANARCQAIETHQDAAGRSLRLRYSVKGFRHVVAYDRPGEVFPASRTFRTVEEARAFWAEKRREWACMAYERRDSRTDERKAV